VSGSPLEPRHVALICVLCQRPLVPGDRLTLDGDGLSHIDCLGSESAVGQMLRGNPGRAICHSCIAIRLGLRWEAVRKTVWALRISPRFDVRPGLCTNCHRARVVVTAVPTSESATTE
jgi:hypothetical protein